MITIIKRDNVILAVVPLQVTSQKRLCSCEAIGAKTGRDGRCGVVGGVEGGEGGKDGRQEQAVIDETRWLSDRHSEAGTPGLSLLQLTGSSGCQAPVGNHLPQQLDYLFFAPRCWDGPYSLSRLPPPHASHHLPDVCVHLPEKECLNFWTKKKKKAMKASYISGW